MWRSLPFTAFLALSIIVGVIALARGEVRRFSPYVDASGGIALPDPKTVRAQWDLLGTWAVRGDEGVAEFHAVYTQPGTIAAFRRTGAFPDGAVLVKEVRNAAQGSLTTGEVAWSGAEVQWFVMIKDREGRFPANPLWAEQWGWALFPAGDRATNTATDFQADCMGCHEPAKATEWVFLDGYPVLRD